MKSLLKIMPYSGSNRIESVKRRLKKVNIPRVTVEGRTLKNLVGPRKGPEMRSWAIESIDEVRRF